MGDQLKPLSQELEQQPLSVLSIPLLWALSGICSYKDPEKLLTTVFKYKCETVVNNTITRVIYEELTTIADKMSCKYGPALIRITMENGKKYLRYSYACTTATIPHKILRMEFEDTVDNVTMIVKNLGVCTIYSSSNYTVFKCRNLSANMYRFVKAYANNNNNNNNNAAILHSPIDDDYAKKFTKSIIKSKKIDENNAKYIITSHSTIPAQILESLKREVVNLVPLEFPQCDDKNYFAVNAITHGL